MFPSSNATACGAGMVNDAPCVLANVARRPKATLTLLMSTAVVLLVLAPFCDDAWADGGTGGAGSSGAGGAGFAGAAGSPGTGTSGGGGGGAGGGLGGAGAGGGGAGGNGGVNGLIGGTVHIPAGFPGVYGRYGLDGGQATSARGGGGGGGAGGFGAIATTTGGTSSNAGFLYGASGGFGGMPAANGTGANGNGGDGGAGFLGTAGTIFTNAAGGYIGGGNGGGTFGGVGGLGGNGVTLGTGSTMMNAGSIRGGGGAISGFNGPPMTGSAGGVGVSLGGHSSLTNSGSIAGGIGGGGSYGPRSNGGAGGVGGAGAVLGAGSSLTNSGSIQGGDGGSGGAAGLGLAGSLPGIGGNGGAGVTGNGIVINNTGSISGGLAGGGAQSYAIVLTGGTNAIGGSGSINGGINVMGAASFMPAVPGSAVGAQPLAIHGPLIFASTSTYTIRITPSANDSTVVNGTATLNGAKVRVEAGKGLYRAGTRKIVTATTVNGKFSTVSTNLAFLRPTLSYDATNVFLTISGGRNFVLTRLTQNETAVAQGLTAAARRPQGPQGTRILTALDQLTVPQARAAFDSLSGEGITAAQNIAHRSAELFTASIFDQTTFYGNAANAITLSEPAPGFTALAPEQTLAAARQGQPIRELADLPATRVPPVFVAPTRTWRAWATGFGGAEDIHGNAVIGSARQDNTIYGGSLGVDYQVTPNYLAGIAIGGTNGDFRVANRGTSGSTTGGHIAFYDIATFGNFYGATSSSFSYYKNQSTRFVSGFGGLGNESERGDFDSHEFRQRLEFGRHFVGYGGTITPFVALELADLRSNGFGETAITGPGLFRLNVNGQSAADVPGFVGVRYQSLVSLGNGMVLSPTLQLAYVHEFAPYRQQFGNLSALPGASFLIDGARPSENAAQVKAGGELRIGAHSSLFASFNGEFSRVDQLYAGTGGFRYVW